LIIKPGRGSTNQTSNEDSWRNPGVFTLYNSIYSLKVTILAPSLLKSIAYRQERAIQTVIEQAKLLAKELV
jgi:hypothetical protein